MSDLLDFSPSGQTTFSLAGAKARFYDAGTTNPITVYSDEGLSIAHPTPLLADSSGRFAQAFVAEDVTVKVVVTRSNDATGYTLDPCMKTTNRRSEFQSRNDAIAATVTSDIDFITVLHGGRSLNYRRDASGTALSTNGSTVNWSPADTPTPQHWGALGNDVADDLAAFNSMTTWVAAWGAMEIPEGNYRLSGTWIIKNKYRVKLACRGVLKPHGSFSDYLVHFDNDTGDPLVPSMAQQITVQGLTLDCEWKCRGVKLEKQYDSAFDHIQVWRPYGTGIACPMVQEISMYQPMIISGRPRVNTTVQAAADWNSGTTYSAGTVVKRAYAAYNAGTAYVAADLVESGGLLYRALKASTGQTPSDTANYDEWELIPIEYFEATALAGNTNKDPHSAVTDFTTRSSVSADQFWKPVYIDEAAWEFVGNGASVTIDNPKIFGFISRANGHNTIIRVDGNQNSFPPAKIEFYGPQLHAITSAYITAFNADSAMTTAYGGTVATPGQGKLVHLVHATGFKIIGGQMQVGDLDRCKALICGTLGISGNAAKTFLSATQIEGTASGDAQVGISILPSVETAGANWVQSGVNIVTPAATSVAKIDPKGETEFFQTGQASISAGGSSVAVTFPTPFAAVPRISLDARGNLGGLSMDVSSVTTSGFTLTLRGAYTGPRQSAAFTSGGGTNQTNTYTHNFGTTADTYVLFGASADGGANYRVNLSTNGVNAIAIVAPAAPAVDLTQSWAAVWDAKVPVATQVAWTAQVEPDA